MRLIFAGTPEFAATALAALIAAGHTIALVLSQPDRPAGRGMKMQASAVKRLALDHGIEVIQPQGLRIGGRHDADARAAHDRLLTTPHDAMIVAAYGLILPPAILAMARFGCINIHASLLPRWRGAAPVQRAIEAGDTETGITVMQMDAGLDTGAMLLVRCMPIVPTATGGSLTADLAVLGGEAIVAALPLIESGELRPIAQPTTGVTYAAKLGKAEGELDFRAPARAIVDRVRAFDPWPGCSAILADDATPSSTTAFKIWKAEVVPGARGSDDAGLVLGRSADGAVLVAAGAAAGAGVIALTELQKPGGKRQPAALFAADFAAVGALRFALPALIAG